MILFLDIPDEDSFVHASGDKVFGVEGPPEIEDVLGVAHEFEFNRPSEYSFRAINGFAILPFLPDCDALVIGARGHKGPVRGEFDNIRVFISFAESVQDPYIFVFDLDRFAVEDDLPNLDAPFGSFSLFFLKFLLIRSSTDELIIQRMEIN